MQIRMGFQLGYVEAELSTVYCGPIVITMVVFLKLCKHENAKYILSKKDKPPMTSCPKILH
jgi:hypothetical protein